MLCRALLAAAVFTYVLCVLLLSGVQKEDIDASILRKLQRHNVNIDDINDRQLQKQCLGKTDLPVTLTTPQTNLTTEKPKTEILTNKIGSQEEDTTTLQKIVEYLQFMRREEKFESKHNTKKKLGLEPLTTLLSSPSNRDRTQGKHFENPSSKTPLLKTLTVTTKDDEKIKMANMNTELDNIINILRMNIGRTSDATHEESTTAKILKDASVSKNTTDIDYITKIVEEIMSKRQLNEFNTNTSRKPNFNANETFREVDQMVREQSINRTVSPTNYFLNNCKLGNFYGNKEGDTGNYDNMFNNGKRLISGFNLPGTNADDDAYVICKRLKAIEKKIVPEQNDNPLINNILNELKKESQRFKLFDKKGTVGISSEQTAYYNLKNGSLKTSSTYEDRKTVDKEIIRSLEHQPKNVILNGQSNSMKTSDTYTDELHESDKERNKALQDVLETQSKFFNQIFNQQRNLIKMCNTDKEKLKLQTESQTNCGASDQINEPIVSINTYKEKQTDPSMYIDVMTHKLNTKIDDDPAKEMKQSSLFGPLKQNDNMRDWLNNEVNNKQKTTNTLNRFERDPIFDKKYNRPWFYAGLSNKLVKPKMIGTLHGQLFMPNGHDKISNTNEPRPTSYKKSWSPYFDTVGNNTANIRTNEYVMPKDQRSILVESAIPQWIQSNDQALPQELMNSNHKYPKIEGVYQIVNKYPTVVKDGSAEQFEPRQDKKINQDNCQTIHETKIECLSADEYKSNWAYFRNKQSKKEDSKMIEHNEETEYFSNNIRTKQNNYNFPSRPKTNKMPMETNVNRFETNVAQDDSFSQNVSNDSMKSPSFPPNIIKDIANSIKDIVLRDLTTATKPPMTSVTTIIPTTTTIPQTTTTIPTTTTTTIKSTTIEETLATSAKQSLKMQDATKALEKMMEMFEKITLMKDKILKPENGKLTQEVIYSTKAKVTTHSATIQGQERVPKPNEKNPTPYDQRYVQLKTENLIPQYPQSLLSNLENREPYVSEAIQPKVENLLPYDPQYLQRNPENFVPYGQPIIQRIPENGLPYNSQPTNRHPEKRVSYNPQPLQRSIENDATYVPKDIQPRVDSRLGYDPKGLQRNLINAAESHLPNVHQLSQNNLENRAPYDSQPLHHNPETRIPNYLQLLQNNQGSRTTYDTQVVQPKAENPLPYNPHDLQGHPENRETYYPENRTYVPESVQQKNENGMRYFPLAVQSKTENRPPYDTQGLQHNPENRVPYRSKQYVPNTAELQAENSKPYFPQAVRVNTENYLPYDPNPLQHNSKNQPYDYSAMDRYHHSKIAYETYLKEVQPVTQHIDKPAPSKKVITVQTNSGEISPLKIVLQKPFVQNIVLTTKPPIKVHYSDETFNFRKPRTKANRHQVEVKESEMSDIKENAAYIARHTHKDSIVAIPRSRKTKMERDVIQHKSREHQEIERFHEKLERGDEWPHEQEKIAKRVQRPIVKNTNYDDTHFRNFLQTQQKVNAMLEKILATGKTKPISGEII